MEFFPGGADVLPYRLQDDGRGLYEPVPGARVAVPDVEALAGRLRWHREHAEESRRMGEAAREAVAGLTWLHGAKRLLEEVGLSGA